MTSLLTIFVPSSMHSTTFQEVAIINGNRIPTTYQPRIHEGHVVVDVPLSFFLRATEGPHGKWGGEANPEAMEWLGQADRRTMTCSAFPGSSRPPLQPPTP